MKKKIVSILAAMTMAALILTGCGSGSGETTVQTENGQTETQNEVQTEAGTEGAETAQTEQSEAGQTDEGQTGAIRIGGLSGPTSMGLVKLMEDAAAGTTANTYEFADLATDPSTFVAPLASGEIDIAAVPSNLASVIYNNTQGGVQLLAVNTMGVVSIVERGETVQSVADLAGKTIYATGQGAIPEYTLRYILQANGLDADTDMTIQWCSDTTEALSYITQDEAAIAALPQPFVTAAMAQVEGLRIALDLNDEWEKLDAGCSIVTGVLVARTEFVEENPEAVAAFLEEYEASINYLSEAPADAAALVEKYGIVKAAIAEKAIPNCHITFAAGQEMKDLIAGFYDILYEANPQAVGGSVPGDDFYYGAN